MSPVQWKVLSTRIANRLLSQQAVRGSRHSLVLTCLSAAVALSVLTAPCSADPFPPNWNGGAGTAVHYQPVNWPADDGDGLLDFGDWQPYRFTGVDSQDQSVQDPSNGGTAPQNYVNVSSGCTDLLVPSTFLYFDDVNEVLMFRWRVEQIPFTYATGPSAGPASAVDPWKSALWTVLMDTDSDGYREFAVHLDGSSGAPATQIDRLSFIYSDKDSNSIDYVNESDICLLGHNPTAFTDGPGGSNTGNILNFQSSLNPSPVWAGGAGEQLFDYGTTRGRVLRQDEDNDGSIECVEYFVDYQIPLAALDATASACNGPAIDLNTPICLAFATSNSLNNPFQKDIVFEGELCADGSDQIPTGDCFTLAGGTVNYLDQPIVNTITASGCGPATLSATLSDAVGSDGCGLPLNSSIFDVDFYYYEDDDGNGIADDGNAWTFAAQGVEDAVGEWSADWTTTLLPTGLYLIGVRAEDDQGNVTWSYLTEAEVIAQEGSIDPNYANPTPTPGVVTDQFINSCGTSPSVVKTASVSEVPAGQPVDFTITVNASLAAPLTVTQIDDPLPSGWTYASNQGGTLSPTTSPTGGASGTISWTFAPGVVIPAGNSGTLIFRATAPAAQGTYTNAASAATNEGTIQSDPVQISVGAPRLTIAKEADVLSTVPGGTIVYTINYSNDSPVATTNTVVTDVVPIGLTFVSATGGGSYDANTRTVTWNAGTLFPGDGPFSVSFTATVDNPLPAGATVPILNTAVIDSDQTSPASNDATVFVNLPLRIQKSANTDLVAPGGNVVFTIQYANTGNANALNATITDPIPTGFTFVSATGGGLHAAGTVTWNLGTLAPGATGSVTFTAAASNPFTGSAVSVNTATLTATGLSSVEDSYEVGISGQCVSTTYFMKNVTGDVGAAGTRSLANTTFPTATSPTILPPGGLLIDNNGATPAPLSAEMTRFYSSPPVAAGGIIVGNVTAPMYINKDSGTKTEFTLTLYDYDPIGGSETQIGTQTLSTQGGSGGTFLLTFSFSAGGTLVPEGHRLLWVLVGSVTSTGGSKSVIVRHYVDGTSDGGNPTLSTWESQSTACLSSFATTLNKQVNNLTVLPGGALQYTIEFGNPGAGAVTGATITDVLPDGVTYVSSTLNGVAAAPTINGQELTFTVNGPGDPAGTIATGNTGTVVITVNVNNPLGAAVTALVNDATLTTNEAPERTAQASTVVQRPNLVIAKAVDDTLLIPGDTATYTLTVTNAGNVAANTVTVTDDFPDQSYFTYGGCVVDTTNAPTTTMTSCTESPVGTLSGTADVLAIGETVIYTFTMDVTTVPLPPSGLTELDNFATVTSVSDATVSQSETVTVTISTNPNLQISKTSTPAMGPLAAGDTVTYTLTIGNTGSADADDVLVYDPVPSNTSYESGTIAFQAVSQTDQTDGDTGAFNAGSNRPQWDIGTLAAGASRSMTFDVTLDSSLPNGTTVIANTATVTSSNAGLKQASADLDAEAAPEFAPAKSAPASMALPLTTVNGAVAASTTLVVDDATLISVLDYIYVDTTAVQVTGIAGNTLTLASAITAADGINVNPVIDYVINYENTGTATATNVEITDDLPTDTVFVAADNGGTHDAGSPGTVTWTVGTVAPGANGTLRFWARPTTTGTFLNTATLASTELADVDSNTTTTDIGVLEPNKESAQPAEAEDGAGETVTNNTGTTVEYYLRVTNNSGATATNIEIVDTMETGFTFNANASISLEPNNGVGSRTSTVDPTAGDNPATWCCWDLQSGGTIVINFVADIAANVGSGTYQNHISVTSDNVAALAFDELATSQDDVTVDFTGPNHVVITDVAAALDDQGRVVVEWETDAETGTLGFRLLRVDPDGLAAVSDSVLPSFLAPQGSVYRAVDADAPTGSPSTYVILEIQSDGMTPVYGPFYVDPLGLPKVKDGHILTGKMLDLGDGFSAAPRAQRPRATGLSKDRAKAKPPAEPANGLRLGVSETGVYRIEVATLATALGVSENTVSQALRTGQLDLTLNDVSVPWISDGQGQAEALVFYGRASETLYSAERIYRLSFDRGERMGNVNAAAQNGDLGQAFGAVAGFQEDVTPRLSDGIRTGDEFWYWELAANLAGFDRRSFRLETPGVVGSGDASITIAVQGLAARGVENGFRLRVNGTEVGEARFVDRGPAQRSFYFDSSILHGSFNEVVVEALAPVGAGMTVFGIDRFDLSWPRDYDAREAAQFRFAGEDYGLVQVRRLATDDLLVLDVTDETAPAEVRGALIDPDPAGGFALSLSPRESDRRYAAVARSAMLAPSSIAVDHPSDLRGASGADWVAIAHSSLLDGAESLAAHRRALGHETMVVDIDDVMDEFAGGQMDPFAIREFLAWAVANWSTVPRYVVLVGEGTFDYKDAWGYGTNLLPPAMIGGPSGLFPSDSALGDLVGNDGIPEVAIGRVPVLTAAELDAWVDKIIAYETMSDEPWMNDLLFVADNPDSTGNYPQESDRLAALLPPGFDRAQTSIGRQTVGQVRADLLSGLQNGTGLVSVIGHASLTGIFHERVLTTDDVPGLGNGDRQAVVSAMSCYLGNYAFPGFDSLAESLVLQTDGGAAAVLSPSGLSYNSQRRVLGEAFQRAVTQQGIILLGDAFLQALTVSTVSRETLLSEVLLGDPALRLRLSNGS